VRSQLADSSCEKCDEIVGAVAIMSEPSALAMKTPDEVD